MKGLGKGLVVSSFILASAAVPAMAVDLFVVRIIECGDTGSFSGCGSNPATAGSEPSGLGNHGTVTVNGDGRVTVELVDATPSAIYEVFAGNWVTSGAFQHQHGAFPGLLGTITTDAEGAYDGPIDRIPGGAVQAFSFPAGTRIGQPNFAFNRSGATQFTTGFRVAP